MGGAVLADIMKNKNDFWMTRKEYQEKGLKCLEKLGVSPKWELWWKSISVNIPNQPHHTVNFATE